jgi:hypothetical protein
MGAWVAFGAICLGIAALFTVHPGLGWAAVAAFVLWTVATWEE